MFEIAGKLVKSRLCCKNDDQNVFGDLFVSNSSWSNSENSPLPHHHEKCLGTSLGVSTIDINTFCNKNGKIFYRTKVYTHASIG